MVCKSIRIKFNTSILEETAFSIIRNFKVGVSHPIKAKTNGKSIEMIIKGHREINANLVIVICSSEFTYPPKRVKPTKVFWDFKKCGIHTR